MLYEVITDFAEKAPRAVFRQQQRVLAAPAEAGLRRERDLHDRRGIAEHTMAERADALLDRITSYNVCYTKLLRST